MKTKFTKISGLLWERETRESKEITTKWVILLLLEIIELFDQIDMETYHQQEDTDDHGGTKNTLLITSPLHSLTYRCYDIPLQFRWRHYIITTINSTSTVPSMSLFNKETSHNVHNISCYNLLSIRTHVLQILHQIQLESQAQLIPIKQRISTLAEGVYCASIPEVCKSTRSTIVRVYHIIV